LGEGKLKLREGGGDLPFPRDLYETLKRTHPNDPRKPQTAATTGQLRIRAKEKNSERLMESAMNTKRPHDG